MVKFTIITTENKDALALQRPWEKDTTYTRKVPKEGRTYELIKYVKDASYWERFVCALSAAWLLIKSCGSNQKKVSSYWDQAMGRKKICLRYGSEITFNPPDKKSNKEPNLEEEAEAKRKADLQREIKEMALKDPCMKVAMQNAAEAAKLGHVKRMQDIIRWGKNLPEDIKVNEVREAFKRAVQPKIAELLAQPDINDNAIKIEELKTIYILTDDKSEVAKWEARLAKLGALGKTAKHVDPAPNKESIDYDKQFDPSVLEAFKEGVKKAEKEKFDAAKNALLFAAKAGYQPAANKLRELCEQQRLPWDAFYGVVNADSTTHKLALMKFSEPERARLKDAMLTANADALFGLAQECEKQKKYPEAYLCYCEATQLAHEPSAEAVEKLQKGSFVPNGTNVRLTYLRPAKDIEQMIVEVRTAPTPENNHDIAVEFENQLSNVNLNFSMDAEVTSWKKARLQGAIISYSVAAAEHGHGCSLGKLRELGYDKYSTVQQAHNAALNKLEAEAKTTRNVDLYLHLSKEYQLNESLELTQNDPETIKAWLKVIAKGQPFDETIGELKDGYNYKGAEMCAEAAKLGSVIGMSEFGRFTGILPDNYVKEVSEAFKAAIQPKIAELLGQPDINDNKEKILELKHIYKLIGDQGEVDKWQARLNALGYKAGTPMRAS